MMISGSELGGLNLTVRSRYSSTAAYQPPGR